MAELIRRHGGEPISAPSMREVPLEENRTAFDYVHDLNAGLIDVAILMTGVGVRTLASVVASEWPAPRLAQALRRARLVARGPKPVAALRELDLRPDLTVPEPNTWREIVGALDAELPVRGLRVAVQEYGVSNRALLDALRERGADVRPVAVYRWALPDNLEPLREAIEQICSQRVDVVVFTSATQVFHVFQVATPKEDTLRRALCGVVVASIGPVCSEGLRENGVEPDIEPARGKLGLLVAAVAERAQEVLAVKSRG